MRTVSCALASALALLAPAGAPAATTSYMLQPIASLGQVVGGVTLPANGNFLLGGFSDSGQILFDVGTDTDRLIQYADGAFTPIADPGGDGPLGPWPASLGVFGPAPQSMNRSGQVVYAVGSLASASPGSAIQYEGQGTFLWDPKTATSTAVAVKDLPGAGGFTITDPGGFVPAINNRGEIALVAQVSGPGGASGYGIFFRSPDGRMQTVLAPGQVLPGGGTASPDSYLTPSINDAGQVAFVTRRAGDAQDSAYVWQNGTLAPVVVAGADLPGIGKVQDVSSVTLNDTDSSMLVTLATAGADVISVGPYSLPVQGLYRVTGGTMAAVAVPGQAMPDGATFGTIESIGPGPNGEAISAGVSAANMAGEHAFIAQLADGTTAAYRVDADGKLTPVLRQGAGTNLGILTGLGDGLGSPSDISVNSQGQVVLIGRINKGPQTLLLLTPAAP